MRRIFFVVLMLLVTLKAFAQTSADVRAADSAILSNQDIKFTVHIEKSTSTDSCPSASSWRWGAEQSCPTRKIGAVKISFKGRSVFIPYSAFADLGNPATIGLRQDGKGSNYTITIYGGDAGTSYECVLRFKGGVLQEKHVKSGEFPDNAWEKTSYRFNF